MEAKMVALKSGGVKWVPEMSSEEFVEVTEACEGFLYYLRRDGVWN